MSKPTVGMIGLGLMGQAMARRLIETGHAVAGYDIVAEKVAAAAALGVQACGSPAEVARASDIVLVSVTTTAAVEEAVLGKHGIASAGRLDGKVLVDHSTTEIETTKRVAAGLAAATGMAFVDAPVSGGPAAAQSGTLAIMAGGEAAAIARIRPVHGATRPAHASGACRRRPGDQARQPDAGADQLLRDRRGAASGRGLRRRCQGSLRRWRRGTPAPICCPCCSSG